MSGLDQYVLRPRGGDGAKVACFLEGGRFSGDRGSIVAPAPDLLAVAPCDCATVRSLLNLDRGEGPCGSLTHWHDVPEGDVIGDIPAHCAYYVLVHTHPAPSGMRAALYQFAGFERPTRALMRAALNDFERHVAAVETHAQRTREQ